jgi:hypothetical protein
MDVAPSHGAGIDAEAVIRPDAAGEAFREVLAREADMARSRLLRLRERDGGRHVDVGSSGTCLGDHRLPVEEEQAAVLLGDGQRPVERRRQAQRHLCRAVDKGGEAPRGIAAVRRMERATEAPLDHHRVFA